MAPSIQTLADITRKRDFSTNHIDDTAAGQSRQTLVIAIIFPVLATLSVVLRFYGRISILKIVTGEDWLILAALIFSIGTTIATIFEVHYGLGRHAATLSEDQLSRDLQALFASILVYNLALVTVKLSIFLQYKRICNNKSMHYAIWGAMAFVTLYGVSCIVTGVWTCIPINKFWDPTVPGYCISKTGLWFANASINIFTDIMVLVFPVFILRHVMIPRRQKMVVVTILSVGGLAVISSILRVHAISIFSNSDDPTWNGPPAAYWSVIEINIGIMCASACTLRPLIARIAPRLASYFNRTRDRTAKSHEGSKSLARTSEEEKVEGTGSQDGMHSSGDITFEEAAIIGVKREIDVDFRRLEDVEFGVGSSEDEMTVGTVRTAVYT